MRHIDTYMNIGHADISHYDMISATPCIIFSQKIIAFSLHYFHYIDYFHHTPLTPLLTLLMADYAIISLDFH